MMHTGSNSARFDGVGIQLTDITKTYPDGDGLIAAVTEVNMTVGYGEIVALYGPSGSGKSTLLALCGALLTPDSGVALIAGENTNAMSNEERARLRRQSIGFVFQDAQLLSVLTARENVKLALEAAGHPSRDAASLTVDALETVGLADLMDRLPENMSGGQRQRVSIARAISGGRKILIADEPSASLDSENSRLIGTLLRDAAARSGCAVLLATHDPILEDMASRTLEIRDGILRERTTTASGVTR